MRRWFLSSARWSLLFTVWACQRPRMWAETWGRFVLSSFHPPFVAFAASFVFRIPFAKKGSLDLRSSLSSLLLSNLLQLGGLDGEPRRKLDFQACEEKARWDRETKRIGGRTKCVTAIWYHALKIWGGREMKPFHDCCSLRRKLLSRCFILIHDLNVDWARDMMFEKNVWWLRLLHVYILLKHQMKSNQ